MKIKILHLYPDLLNLYGDDGNIAALTHRLTWRGAEAEVIRHMSDMGDFELDDIDLLFIGGGTDREERSVMEMLCANRGRLSRYIEGGGVVLAVCGGLDMLGKYCEFGGETAEGAAVLDIYTKNSKERMTGDVIAECGIIQTEIVGFENRARKTYIGNNAPLCRVRIGSGNNGEDFTEGVVYKNVTGTHLHGPILPKNPKLCDYVLGCALKKKYGETAELKDLSDEFEDKARAVITDRYSK